MKKTILSIVLALSAPALFAGDLTKKGEFSLYGGGNHFGNGGGNAGIWGTQLGYGVAKKVTLFGEFDHNRDSGSNLFDYLGGAKFSLMSSEKAEPYGLVGFGAGRSGGETRAALHIGGGVRFYVNSKWGIVPEIRWVRYFEDFSDLNSVRYTGGVFFQW
jgi:hypothetical protein